MILNSIKKVRSIVMKFIRPSSAYFLATRSVHPISSRFGFDRGTPIDRYYIEKFLFQNRKSIKGKCLEIVDNTYTKKFGGKKVTISDVLDNDPKNNKATICSDLRRMSVIKDNTYDTLVITHTLGMVDSCEKAVKECYRILKPGGTILVTSSFISPLVDIEASYWRFTPVGIHYVFSKAFTENKITVQTFGNVLSGQCFWVGMAQEELTKEELDYNDPRYPCILAVKATK